MDSNDFHPPPPSPMSCLQLLIATLPLVPPELRVLTGACRFKTAQRAAFCQMLNGPVTLLFRIFCIYIHQETLKHGNGDDPGIL